MDGGFTGLKEVLKKVSARRLKAWSKRRARECEEVESVEERRAREGEEEGEGVEELAR